jgi:SAM-dependent methyltransferase
VSKPSSVYTHGHHESVLRSHTWRTAANSAGYLLPRLQPHMRVLDIGCGPGTITADLAELVPHGSVMAIDAAGAIVEQARANAVRRGLTNVDFAVGDAHALAFPDGSFDVVHAHQVLQHVGDPVMVLREMGRVCAPGGVVAVRDADYAAMTWHPALPGLTAWRELYEKVARANGGEPDAGRQLLSWARAAGLTDITASASVWCFATTEDRAWWGGLWADRTLASGYARMAVDGGYATASDLEDIAAAWREWSSNEDGWFAVLHGEILARTTP